MTLADQLKDLIATRNLEYTSVNARAVDYWLAEHMADIISALESQEQQAAEIERLKDSIEVVMKDHRERLQVVVNLSTQLQRAEELLRRAKRVLPHDSYVAIDIQAFFDAKKAQ